MNGCRSGLSALIKAFFLLVGNRPLTTSFRLSPKKPMQANASGFKPMSASPLGKRAEPHHIKWGIIKWSYWSRLRGEIKRNGGQRLPHTTKSTP